jgi:hypothetical protein
MYCLATGGTFMSDKDVLDLRASDETFVRSMVEEAPRWAWTMLGELLQPDPVHRATAGQALDHDWLDPIKAVGPAMAVYASPKGCEVRTALKARPVPLEQIHQLEQRHQEQPCRTLAQPAGPTSVRAHPTMSSAVRQQSKNSMVISSVCDSVLRRASVQYMKEQCEPVISSTVQDAIKIGLAEI